MSPCPSEVLALDGKTLRPSFDTATGSKAIPMVRAWAGHTRLVLGQSKVEDKSNAIPAILALLALLALNGCIVTLDARGCQKAIAKQIVEPGGDHGLALKGNPEQVPMAVRLFFEHALKTKFAAIPHQFVERRAKDQGRIQTRRVWQGSLCALDKRWWDVQA